MPTKLRIPRDASIQDDSKNLNNPEMPGKLMGIMPPPGLGGGSFSSMLGKASMKPAESGLNMDLSRLGGTSEEWLKKLAEFAKSLGKK